MPNSLAITSFWWYSLSDRGPNIGLGYACGWFLNHMCTGAAAMN
ncbi:MAG: hypothetical protein R3C24_19945 [Cyanobacteriota/Melainabacteria group bacterium]